VLQVRECTPTPSPFIIFTFGLVVDFIKEFIGASIGFEKPCFKTYYNVKNYFYILFGRTLLILNE
jgi:hypothetical protein